MKERICFVAVEFAKHDRTLTDQFVLIEKRITNRILHELEAWHEAVHADCYEIVDTLFTRGAVPRGPELVETPEIRLLRRYRPVRLEEHVLVKMRQP